VKEHQAEFPIRTMCEVLGVSTSGYYSWRKRTPSKHAQRDAELSEIIVEVHQFSRGTYGAPRIHEELKEAGQKVSQKRIARLMREAGIRGVCRRRFPTTTTRNSKEQPAEDLVERVFKADRPNQLWIADITYVETVSGFLYLAVVIDVFSRKVVGWAMRNHLKTELVLAALSMAIEQRNPEDVIHHSDQGTQYTSIAFGKRCKEMGVRPSMGSVGDCYDNAMCESFFATLECELLDRHHFQNHKEAMAEIFSFIEGWYNPHRRHSSLGYQSPNTYERRMEIEVCL
jgi:transposase InsO family protein